jgi:hypothetical protein
MIKELMKINDLTEFECECEGYRDKLFNNPEKLTLVDLIYFLKMTNNLDYWIKSTHYAVMKLVSLLRMLEPVYGVYKDVDKEKNDIITNICLNFISSEKGSLQYAPLDLVEAGIHEDYQPIIDLFPTIEQIIIGDRYTSKYVLTHLKLIKDSIGLI